MPILLYNHPMDIKDHSETVDSTINDKIFTEATNGFKLHLGGDRFYNDPNVLPNFIAKKEPVIASCPAGKERSYFFNSLTPASGVIIPKVTIEGKNDMDSPLNGNSNEGVSQLQLFDLLVADDITVSDQGIKSKYLDKPIKHLVLITQLDNFQFLNKVERALVLLKEKYGEKLPITVDVVVEYDVQRFQKETKDFVASHKAA